MLSKNDFIENNLIPNNGNNKDNSTKLKEFLQQNIPEALNSNGEPDLTKIKNLLGLNSLSGYELKFPGKGIANALYSATIYKELQNENPTNDIAENFIIEGDNLDALKILAKAYTNKIKMIYIDPPYNTGTDDFVYNDNFRSDFDSIAKGCGLIDANGEKTKILKEMESTFKGSKTHSAWLCFMYPRLKLARDLLKDDGVIFISIDDNEQANLKLLCDEIFGEENFIACLPRITTPHRAAQEKYVSITHDYLLIYGFDPIFKNIISREYDITKVKKDNIGYYLEKDTAAILASKGQGYSQGGDYDFELYGKIYKPIDSKGNRNRWLWKKERMEKAKELGILRPTKNGGLRVQLYLDKKFDDKTNTMIDKDENLILTSLDFTRKTLEIDNTKGTEELNKIFYSNVFLYPKPTNLLKLLIQIATNPNDNDIILDFFAGSGTTAHAVMAQNLADNGNRKFILVQLDEAINEKKNKTAFDFCKNELQSPNPVISNITIERIKRAKKILNSPCNFDVYKIINEPEIDIENDFLGQRNQQNPLNLITNLLLKAGEEIGGKNIQCLIENKLYKVDTNYFVINFVANDEELFNILQADKNGKIFADMYINCDIESWLNFQIKFKERLTIL